jgi:hypothetical protein
MGLLLLGMGLLPMVPQELVEELLAVVPQEQELVEEVQLVVPLPGAILKSP